MAYISQINQQLKAKQYSAAPIDVSNKIEPITRRQLALLINKYCENLFDLPILHNGNFNNNPVY